MQSFNPHEPVKAIIAALNEARVPIAAIDNVFELVKADIKNHTVPYNPSLDNAKDLAVTQRFRIGFQKWNVMGT